MFGNSIEVSRLKLILLEESFIGKAPVVIGDLFEKAGRHTELCFGSFH